MHIRILLAATTAGALVAGVSALTLPVARAGTVIDAAHAGIPAIWGDASAARSTVVPTGLGPIIDVAVNNTSTAVVTADGRLYIWGDSTSDVETDAPEGVTDAASIALSGTQALLLHRDGSVTGWGTGSDLMAGAAGIRAKAIALGFGTAYAVTTAGRLVSWGGTPGVPVPTRVSTLTDVVDVAVGAYGGLALKADNTAVAWGLATGEEGQPDPLNTVPDLGTRKVEQIAVGGFTNGLVLDDGSVEIWGLSVPDGQPTFTGKVKALSLSTAAAAVVEDATGRRSVELWGTTLYPDLTDPAREAELDGRPVADVVMGENHAAAIVTTFRDLTKPSISGAAILGQTLQATDATFTLTPTAPVTGQWFTTRNNETTPVEDATTRSLTVTQDLLGATLTYRTTARYNTKRVVSTSKPTAPAAVTSKVTLSVMPGKGAFGTPRTVTATVAAAGNPAAGSVTFASGGLSGTRPLASGKASWTLPTSLAVGSHTVTATYAGNAGTVGSSASTRVTVTKVTPKISVKTKASGKTKKLAKKVRVTVTVRGLAKVSGSGKVTIIFKGKTKKKVVAKVNSQGIAKVSLKKIKRGRYTVSVNYAGNSNVAAAAIRVKANI